MKDEGVIASRKCESCEHRLISAFDEPCKSCIETVQNNYKPVESDPVNHPDHYCQEGSVECIDEMIAVFGVDAVRTFCLLNVWIYHKRKRTECQYLVYKQPKFAGGTEQGNPLPVNILLLKSMAGKQCRHCSLWRERNFFRK